MKIIQAAAFAGMGTFGLYGAFHPQGFSFFNGVNLLFHEAGHLFFMPMGEYLHIWGGTLTQILIPLGIGIGFLVKGQKLSAAVMFWWSGQNFFMISSYIKDAREQVLPFVGGEQHDWEYILNAHRVIQFDHQIGNAVWLAGVFIMSLSVIYGLQNSLCHGKGD